MAEPIPVLFITHAEYGQANVVLAVAQSLARNADFNITIASFAKLAPRIQEINESNKTLARPITFHTIPGIAMEDLAARQTYANPDSPYAHAPGFLPAISSYGNLEKSAFGWKGSEYVEIFGHCRKLIQEVRPAALVIDVAFFMAADAARDLGCHFVMISPSSVKELLGGILPGAPMFWKWPVMSSGLQFPLSMFDTVKNIVLAICFIYTILQGSHIKDFGKVSNLREEGGKSLTSHQVRKEAGLKYNIPLLEPYRKEDILVTSFTPEADYSGLDKLPSNVKICGPITLPPLRPLIETDAPLLQWLQQRPTVLINLGTHFSADRDASFELAKGIKTVLESREDVQILWKLKFDWSKDAPIRSLIEPFVGSNRLRITPWLRAEPSSLLETGHIVCVVHHGGANSYYEAVRAGIPQLVLPVWWDTYEYAERARYRGIGLVGNVGVAPGVEGTQFSSKLLQILNSPHMTERATEISEACKLRGEGRDLAAAEIAKWARSRKTKVVKED
ncbi:hypothetical protein PRZ48_011634 [Zasmidium cellare]|uniref:Erythromycin biosynthesis protein CIII-like C-terminal domain-containing protein n=1 Tax=Zasmidium cellare TaxID=395010 RepID=A0ABR0E6Z2_ZASCE|nr:hypothetical protein PRZ48_011634 [Zasmidium cellare]